MSSTAPNLTADEQVMTPEEALRFGGRLGPFGGPAVLVGVAIEHVGVARRRAFEKAAEIALTHEKHPDDDDLVNRDQLADRYLALAKAQVR